MIGILNYGVGNIKSFMNVYRKLSIPVKILNNESDFDGVEKLILPGVGSFDYAVDRLNASGMRDKLNSLVLDYKVPVLGICVGMQMMGNNSEEGKLQGLQWIDANIVKFDVSKIKYRTKLPHIGWNEVNPSFSNPLFKGLEKDAIFYFLHSYFFKCNKQEDSIAISDYGISFTSAVNADNIFGIQFHPEKSHHYGEKLLQNFAQL